MAAVNSLEQQRVPTKETTKTLKVMEENQVKEETCFNPTNALCEWHSRGNRVQVLLTLSIAMATHVNGMLSHLTLSLERPECYPPPCRFACTRRMIEPGLLLRPSARPALPLPSWPFD